jgi:hypothetical protein
MNALLRNVPALVLLSVSSSALASETWAEGRKVMRSCEYASSYEVEVTVSYKNDTLPSGASVSLVYGWDGGYYSHDWEQRPPFDWLWRQTVAATPGAPFTWSATVRGTTSTRTGTQYYANLDYVWKVVLPGGTEFYDKGNNPSTWGYHAAVLEGMASPCTYSGYGGFIGSPTPLAVMDVVKW